MPLPSCWRTSIATTRWPVIAWGLRFPLACADENRSSRPKSQILLAGEHFIAGTSSNDILTGRV